MSSKKIISTKAPSRILNATVTTVTTVTLVLLSLLVLVPSRSQAEPIQEMTTREAFGDEIWARLKQFYYQTLFDHVGELNSSLYSNSYFNIHLDQGRMLLQQDAKHIMLADHFGLNASVWVPTSGPLTFGGNLGAYLLRIRQLPSEKYAETGSTLMQDLSDWSPAKRLSNTNTFQQNISPWIDAVADDVRAGNSEAAKSILGDNIPEQQYLDLLAGLKLPFEMPWTAARVTNDKKFLIGDLNSFVAQGGIFARLGGNGIGWGSISGPWVGMFLSGQFRFGLLKIGADKCLLRIDTEKAFGTNYNAFDASFSIPYAHGVIFGHPVNPKTTLRPFNVTGISYDSQLFARTYELDFSKPNVGAAYDAAVHGNLTVLDDMAKVSGAGVKVLSERFNNGHYNQSQFQISFGPIQFNNTYANANTEEDFWDERGQFKYFNANSLRANYTDVNLLIYKARQTRTNNLVTEAYSTAPGGPFPPRMSWNFDEVNFAATADDQRQLQDFIESLKPVAKNIDIHMAKYSKFHAGFQIQIHPLGIQDFEKHNADDVWRAAGVILFNDATVWQNASARRQWLTENPDDTENYDQVEHWANAFNNAPATGDYKKWFANLIEWQRASYWDVLGVQLFLALVRPEHRYLKLDFTPDNGSGTFVYDDGQLDLTAYPDDWEYLTIPDIQPIVPLPPKP